MDEITIVRDGQAQQWHVRFIESEDEDLGLTLCGNGDGWKMRHWDYENEALMIERACLDCLIAVGELAARLRTAG